MVSYLNDKKINKPYNIIQNKKRMILNRKNEVRIATLPHTT